MSPGLIVVSGPPGAGKSAVASLLVERFAASALVEGDVFFAMVRRGYVDPWTGPAHRQNEIVVGAAAVAADRIAQGGYTVVYDGVIGPWSLDAFVRATRVATLHYALLLPPVEICVQRVRSRTGHRFTDVDATRHMHREFERAASAGSPPIRSTDPAESIAATVATLVDAGALRIAAASAD